MAGFYLQELAKVTLQLGQEKTRSQKQLDELREENEKEQKALVRHAFKSRAFD